MLTWWASGFWGRAGTTMSLSRGAIAPKGAGGLLEGGRFHEAEDFRDCRQASGAKGVGVPSFDDDDGAGNASKVGGREFEGQGLFRARFVMRVHDIEVGFLVFEAASRGDELSLLAHKEAMQFEIFADHDFAHGSHI